MNRVCTAKSSLEALRTAVLRSIVPVSSLHLFLIFSHLASVLPLPPSLLPSLPLSLGFDESRSLFGRLVSQADSLAFLINLHLNFSRRLNCCVSRMCRVLGIGRDFKITQSDVTDGESALPEMILTLFRRARENISPP